MTKSTHDDAVLAFALFIAFAVGLGIVVGNLLYSCAIKHHRQSYSYSDYASCTKAGGQYRRIVTGERYICYPPKESPP